MELKQYTEYCSECESESTFMWNIEKWGAAFHCLYCGAQVVLCGECEGCSGNCIDGSNFRQFKPKKILGGEK